MIKIDRSSQPSPLDSELVANTRERLDDYYRAQPEVRQRPTAPERLALILRAREALLALFNEKCAYCESLIDTASAAEVDLFRPFADASNLSGEGSSDHYGWLLVEWGNFYLGCSGCVRSKRSLFPVEGPRAPPLTPFDQVQHLENALLIDPCFDEPKDHLQFVESGYVQALTHRGEVTIKVFNLNRVDLVRARAEAWQRTEATLASASTYLQASALATARSPHAAVARAAIQTYNTATRPRLIPESGRAFSQVPTERRSAEEILAADAEAFRLTARPLRRVEIVNFRALRDVSIDFEEPSTAGAPWLVLLGENATGKSTVLQAIGLALAGADEAQRRVRPERLLSSGAFQGSVTIRFWDQEAPAELKFQRGRKRFDGSKGPSAIVLGYGALRYAERRTRVHQASSSFAQIAPLMEPVARIQYPGKWLLDLDEKRFETAARALRSMLPIDADKVQRSAGSVFFDVGGHRSKLAELSAGYQTIIGMCADIMRMLFERWDTLSSATAIVLIDEIDAHLHPRWAMRIVRALREAFPQVQFVASTHDPLTLRGLYNGEVALLRRSEQNELIVDQDLPSIEGLWVDQLLTSRAFGLDSTADPDTERMLNEYHYLRSLPADPSRDARISELRSRIGDRESLGRSEAERLMLAAAERFISQVHREAAAEAPLRLETFQTLRRIAGARSLRRQQ